MLRGSGDRSPGTLLLSQGFAVAGGVNRFVPSLAGILTLAFLTLALGIWLSAVPAHAQFVCQQFGGGDGGAKAAGGFNFACGPGADASGTNSLNTATGAVANASGNKSGNIATGLLANAFGNFSSNVATGRGADASGTDSNGDNVGSSNFAGGAYATWVPQLGGRTRPAQCNFHRINTDGNLA